MKTAGLFVVAIMLFGLRSDAQALLNGGPLALKLIVSSQDLNGAVISKTNSTSKSTTVTTATKFTVSNERMQSADILALLENSFNTNFPAGSQLSVSRLGDSLTVYVTDGSGTNVVLSPTTNCFIGALFGEQPLRSGAQMEISKTGESGASFSGNDAETVTETVTFGYDDSGLTTKDGTHTDLQIAFLLVRKSSVNLVTQKIKDTLRFQGAGNGTIHDKNVILQGSGTGEICGVLFVP